MSETLHPKASGFHEAPAQRAGQECRHCADEETSQGDPTLSSAVESQIVPRLLLAGRAMRSAVPVEKVQAAGESPEEVRALATFARMHDVEAIEAHLLELVEQGQAVEAICLRLLAPAARHLGDLWSDDLLSFDVVSIATWKLRQAMRVLTGHGVVPRQGRRAMVMPLPGDQHTFGLAMVEDFLRLAGWDVWSGIGAAQGEAIRMIGHTWFAVLGVSVSRDEQIPALTREITRMRRASCNRGLGVLAGGPPFTRDPGLAQRVGADATAGDAAQAAATAEQMLSLLPATP